MSTLFKIYHRFAYSEDTYYLLNHFTLRIKDPIIRREYETYAMQRHKSLFLPNFIVMTIWAVSSAIQVYTTKIGGLNDFGWFIMDYIYLLLWGLIIKLKSKWAPIMPFIYIFMMLGISNLIYREWVPSFMVTKN